MEVADRGELESGAFIGEVVEMGVEIFVPVCDGKANTVMAGPKTPNVGCDSVR